MSPVRIRSPAPFSLPQQKRWLAKRNGLLFHVLSGRSMGDSARSGCTGRLVTTSDGVRIHEWRKQRAGPPAVTLFLHGNAGNGMHRADGNAFLILDYRGYGRSEGRSTQSGLCPDVDVAYDRLIAQGWPDLRIPTHLDHSRSWRTPFPRRRRPRPAGDRPFAGLGIRHHC